MPRTAFARINGLATAVILLAMAAGCEPVPEGKGGQAGLPLAHVETVHPERHTVRRRVGEPGELQAFETATIGARIPGYVRSWTVNIGDRVKKGQVIAELSVPELEADVQQKKAGVDQAVARRKLAGAAVKVSEANVAAAEAKLTEVRAGIKRAEADLIRWQAECNRVEQLFKERAQTGSLLDETRNKLHSAEATRDEVTAQIASAEVAVIQARASLEQAHSDVGASAAAIEVARADARHAEALFGFARIEAPFDGIVIQRNVDTGDLTQPGADQPPLFVIARSDVVTIWVAIPELFAPAVNPGDRAEVKLQAIPGRIIEGKVTRISWALDPRVRTLRAEIDIPNPEAKLQPGLYATATIIAEEHPDVLTLPITAVVSEQGKTYCIAVVDGKAVHRPIRIGISDGIRTEVVSGIVASDAVVKANAASLVDGQPVQVIEPASPPSAPGTAGKPAGAARP
ncbi:MAG: efflux RND transporter periplasmic adaptor subunit [Isosphaeraceae bacterium]